MNKIIPYGRQHITQEDIAAVVETLQSDFLTQGPKIKEFEDAFASYIGSEYAVAVSNGTAALHLCALALDVQPGDKVITTPITFAASANCVRYAGGEVVFADIDPSTYLLDIDEVEKLLKASPKGTYKGIIPVDFAGRAVDLEAYRKLADQYGCWIIEDACHAPGGFFTDSKGQQQKCGNGQFAELAIFSFHPVKHIACGEGGMITTNDKVLYEKLLMLRTHGIIKNNDQFQNPLSLAMGLQITNNPTLNDSLSNDRMTSPPLTNDPMTNDPIPNDPIPNDLMPNDPIPNTSITNAPITNTYPLWYYEMQELGFNYRLTDFQAALGLSQLKRADQGLQKRKEIAARYDKAFAGLMTNDPLTNDLMANAQPGHAYHLYIIETEKRKELYDYLREKNIFAQVHYIPVHLMPYYRKFGWKEGDLPHAENYYQRCLSLPMYPTLGVEQQEYVINCIESFLHNAI
ncbi:MAG: aminotransferase class I/II-fold pyridoxal phosphate-dependent enzyme [Bacteroidales bacterium]